MKFILILASLFLSIVTPAYAQTTNWSSGRCVKTVTVKTSNNILNSNAQNSTTYDDIATIQGAECLFFNVLQVIVFLAGLTFLFMFISGGFKYLFSGGEQKSVAAASSTLTMAFIGLIGIIASWLIISFIQKFTGVNITNFVIPG